MRLVHAIGYACAAAFAAAIGASFYDATLTQRVGICIACGALGAVVGWHRLPRGGK